MSSATIPVVEETVSEDLCPYKRDKKPSSRGVFWDEKSDKKPATGVGDE
jgi:hypothetical protein